MKVLVALSALVFSLSAQAETTTFNVKGMHCGACAKSIEEKVCAMEGVKECKAQLTKGKKNMGTLTITTDEGTAIDTAKVTELVGEAGDYTIVKAPKSESKKKN